LLQKEILVNSAGKNNESSRISWLQKSLAQISPGSRILDAGAGEQKFRGLCSHLNYVAQDFAQYDGKGNCRGLQTDVWDQSKLDIVCDITSISEPNNSFDAIMCIEVLNTFLTLLRPSVNFTGYFDRME